MKLSLKLFSIEILFLFLSAGARVGAMRVKEKFPFFSLALSACVKIHTSKKSNAYAGKKEYFCKTSSKVNNIFTKLKKFLYLFFIYIFITALIFSNIKYKVWHFIFLQLYKLFCQFLFVINLIFIFVENLTILYLYLESDLIYSSRNKWKLTWLHINDTEWSSWWFYIHGVGSWGNSMC